MAPDAWLAALAELATRQHGVVHLRQARELGVPGRQLTRWVERSRLAHVAPATFAFAGSPVTWEQRVMVALLEAGEGAVASFTTAAVLHGFDGFRPGPVEVTVLRGQRRRAAPGSVLHTTRSLAAVDRLTVGGFPATSPSRTIIDMAGAVPAQQLEAAIDSALRDGATSERFLRARLGALRARGRAGVVALDRALVDSGGHSHLERRFLALLRSAGMPRPRCQTVHRRGGRFVARTDFCWDDVWLVVEVAGQVRHASPAERQRDAQRHTELQLLGYLVLTFTFEDVRARPGWVVDRVREALARGR